MLNSMQPILEKLPHKTLLDLLLPRLTKLLQGNFIYWIDGGAGVGTTSASYFEILNQELDEDFRDESVVVCYDPLPENAEVLRERFGNNPRFMVREVALSSMCGEATFSIPTGLHQVVRGLGCLAHHIPAH